MQKTFYFDYYDDEEDKKYEGTFVVKTLSLKQRAAQRVKASQMAGGMYYDPEAPPGQGLDRETSILIDCLTFLEASIVSSPKWFSIEEMDSTNLLVALYGEVRKQLSNFPGRSDGGVTGAGPGGSSESSGQASNSQANSGGIPNQVVGQQVQAALEP